MSTNNHIPVITVDGPSGSGKGTLSFKLAKYLGWHYLESGIFYRLLGLLAIEKQIDISDESALLNLVYELRENLYIDERDDQNHIFLHNQEVTEKIREEGCSKIASKISAIHPLRIALLTCQRIFRRYPGLITDGRDMGTVVFPDAQLKIFLNADPAVRAHRRYLQLKQQGINGNLPDVLENLVMRDQNDSEREAAPLRPAADAVIIESTNMSAEEVFCFVVQLCKEKNFTAVQV